MSSFLSLMSSKNDEDVIYQDSGYKVTLIGESYNPTKMTFLIFIIVIFLGTGLYLWIIGLFREDSLFFVSFVFVILILNELTLKQKSDNDVSEPILYVRAEEPLAYEKVLPSQFLLNGEELNINLLKSNETKINDSYRYFIRQLKLDKSLGFHTLTLPTGKVDISLASKTSTNPNYVLTEILIDVLHPENFSEDTRDPPDSRGVWMFVIIMIFIILPIGLAAGFAGMFA